MLTINIIFMFIVTNIFFKDLGLLLTFALTGLNLLTTTCCLDLDQNSRFLNLMLP